MGLGGTLRRLRADPIVTLTTLVTVALTLVLLAAGPIYSEAVAVGALRRSLTDAPVSHSAVDIATLSAAAEAAEVEAIEVAEMDAAFRDVDYDALGSLVGRESFELPDQSDADRVDLVAFAWLDELEPRVRVTAGALPTEPGDRIAGSIVEAAVDAGAAALLGLDVGRRLTVLPRSGGTEPIRLEIVGHYDVIDPFASFWQGRDRLVEPLTVSSAFRTVTLLTSRSAMLSGVSPRPEVSLLAIPRFERIELAEVGPLRGRLLDLERSADERLARSGVESATAFEVRTSAPALLSERERVLTVARSIVFAVVLQLVVLGAFALALVAGLGVDARRAEAAMLRARGASASQLLVRAVLEAALVVVPVAIVAPFAAALVAGLLDDAGPLAGGGFRIEPTRVSAAWLLVAVSAVGTIVLLAWPSWRAARASESSPRPSGRRRPTGGVQRSGIDVAMLTVAALTYWQLRTLGDERAASVQGRFGVDPLLIAAPTFGLVTGAFLALRVVPAAARRTERLIGRTRTAPVALTAWQLARRPFRYSRAVLLVIMAVAIGTFAVAYESTWTRSQSEQAAHEFGADGRLEPNRRTGESVGPLQLPAVIESVDGVRAAMPVVADTVRLPASERPAQLVAVDTDRPDILNDLTQARPDVIEALTALRSRRPPVGGAVLPGEPARLEIAVEVAPGPDLTAPDDEQHPGEPPPFVASAVVVLVDGDGVLHRLDAGTLATGRTVNTVELTAEATAGRTVAPRAPLSLVAIELTSPSTGFPSRSVEVRVDPVVVVDARGERSRVGVDDRDVTLGVEVLGVLGERATISRAPIQPDEGITVSLTTGSSSNDVPVVFSIAAGAAPAPRALAAVATTAWLDTTDTEVGDVIGVSTDRVDDTRVEIVGSVDAVPSVDPTSTDGLLVDLPSLLWFERSPGRPTRPVSEYWIDVEQGDMPTADSMLRPPVEAVAAELLADRERELTNNPAAVGAIGALLLGFGAASTFAIAGFVVTVTVSARERRSEFALLRALGLSRRQHGRWMWSEQCVLVTMGAAFGTLLGLALSWAILPAVSLSQDGSRVFPSVAVVIPWDRIVVLQLLLAGSLLVGVLAVIMLRRRTTDAAAIRSGDDQ